MEKTINVPPNVCNYLRGNYFCPEQQRIVQIPRESVGGGGHLRQVIRTGTACESLMMFENFLEAHARLSDRQDSDLCIKTTQTFADPSVSPLHQYDCAVN
jgi:hypothetical protein